MSYIELQFTICDEYVTKKIGLPIPITNLYTRGTFCLLALSFILLCIQNTV